MQPTILRRLLYFLSKNARMTTKEFGRLLSISQQSASYTIKNLEKEKTIQNYQTVADPAKFGLINIILLMDYQDFEAKTTSAIKRQLREDPSVVRVEETAQGADLLVEYSVPNLSYFNKQHKDFLYAHKDKLEVTEAHVVIVKHHYTKNYLHRRHQERGEIIISGDRDPMALDEKHTTVLKELLKDPTVPVSAIARSAKMDPKTVTAAKRWLERKKIIRGYSVVLDHERLGITREHLFVSLSHDGPEGERRFVEFCHQHKNITAVTKTIGPYDAFITTERL